MPRSIGRKNIGIVKLETELAIKECGHYQVEDVVKNRLPESMYETWEGAATEIERVIEDTIHGR